MLSCTLLQVTAPGTDDLPPPSGRQLIRRSFPKVPRPPAPSAHAGRGGQAVVPPVATAPARPTVLCRPVFGPCWQRWSEAERCFWFVLSFVPFPDRLWSRRRIDASEQLGGRPAAWRRTNPSMRIEINSCFQTRLPAILAKSAALKQTGW